LKRITNDLEIFKERFTNTNKHVGLIVRNEMASLHYTTEVIMNLFIEEGEDKFDVRHCILGHIQQGGDPSPLDRVNATIIVAGVIKHIEECVNKKDTVGYMVGLKGSGVEYTPTTEFDKLVDSKYKRPKHQWWYETVKPVVEMLSQSQAPASVTYEGPNEEEQLDISTKIRFKLIK